MKIVLTGGIACGKSLVAKFLAELGIQVLDADDVVHDLEANDPDVIREIGELFLSPADFAAGGDLSPADFADDADLRGQTSTDSGGQTPEKICEICEISGKINRAKLAEIVFRDVVARKKLEAILFPRVRKRIEEFLSPADFAAGGKSPADLADDADLRGQTPGKICGICEICGKIKPPDGRLKIASIPLLFESQWDKDFDIILCVASSESNQIDRMTQTRGYSRAHAQARLAAQMPVAEKAGKADYTIWNDSTPEHLKEEVVRMVAWLKERVKQA